MAGLGGRWGGMKKMIGGRWGGVRQMTDGWYKGKSGLLYMKLDKQWSSC